MRKPTDNVPTSLVSIFWHWFVNTKFLLQAFDLSDTGKASGTQF